MGKDEIGLIARRRERLKEPMAIARMHEDVEVLRDAGDPSVAVIGYTFKQMVQGAAGVMDIPDRRKPYALSARYHHEVVVVSAYRLLLPGALAAVEACAVLVKLLHRYQLVYRDGAGPRRLAKTEVVRWRTPKPQAALVHAQKASGFRYREAARHLSLVDCFTSHFHHLSRIFV